MGSLRQLALAAAAGGALTLLWILGAMRPFDLPLSDLLLRLPRPGGAAEVPLVAVLIDDRAVEELGALPWPRALVARLVERAFVSGARAVALDLILSEPEDEAGDRALEQALALGPAILAATLRDDGGWLLPLDRFGGARRAAHAEAEIGPDGVVRAIFATKQRGGRALPALALAAARTLRPEIAVAPGALLRPDFRLRPERVPRRSAAAVVAGDLGTGDLEGRLVFIGIAAAGGTDQFVVPTRRDRPSPGVLIQASAAASILRGGLLRPLPAAGVSVACLLLAWLAQVLRSRAGSLRLPPMLAVVAALALAAVSALWSLRVQVPLVTVVAAFGLSALLREALESGLARRRTDELLRRLADELSEDEGTAPAPHATGGRLRLVQELQARLIRDRNLRRTLLDALEDGVVRWDTAGEPLLVNAAARRLWGEPPDLSDVRADARADGEGGVRRRGGRELRVTVQRLESGHLGLLRDVTAERELEHRRREMQRLVSHELKTPLASIAGFGGMLQRYQLSEEELHRLAGLIRGESERLLEMVTTFLDLERLASGRIEGEKGELDLGGLAAERRELIAAAAAERGQTLTFAQQGPARVIGDRQLLARVVDNLAGNALKHTPQGTAVAMEVAGDGQRVELRLRDRGPGIPAESLPRLFERFYRVPGSGAGGSGLGLAMVREIAEWHGGCVRVESEMGAGSVFIVELPAAGAAEDP